MIQTITSAFVNAPITPVGSRNQPKLDARRPALPDINIAHSNKRPQPLPNSRPVTNLPSSMFSAPYQKLVKGSLEPIVQSLTMQSSHNIEGDYSFSSEKQKEKHLNAGLYCLCTYLSDDDLKTLKQDDESVAKLQKQFSGSSEAMQLSTEDAKTMLKMVDSRLNTTEELQQQFPKLDSKQAGEMLDLMKKTDVSLHKDHNSGELIFVARGTQNKGDLLQDAMTGLGAKGIKYNKLEKLVKLINEGSESPEQRPQQVIGHSLGGGMALAAAKGFGDDGNRETIVFDTQALNHKQKKAFGKLTDSSSSSIRETNYRVKSPASLGAIMKSPVMFEQPNTVRLNNAETYLNPVTELATNHKVLTIMDEMRNIPITA